MAQPVRTYLVINASTLTKDIVRFRTAAPTGSVHTTLVNGRRERVVLHGYLVNDGPGRAYAAELLDVYL